MRRGERGVAVAVDQCCVADGVELAVTVFDDAILDERVAADKAFREVVVEAPLRGESFEREGIDAAGGGLLPDTRLVVVGAGADVLEDTVAEVHGGDVLIEATQRARWLGWPLDLDHRCPLPADEPAAI